MMLLGRESLGVRSSNHVGNGPVVPWRSLGVGGQSIDTGVAGVARGQRGSSHVDMGEAASQWGGQIMLTRESAGVKSC